MKKLLLILLFSLLIIGCYKEVPYGEYYDLVCYDTENEIETVENVILTEVNGNRLIYRNEPEGSLNVFVCDWWSIQQDNHFVTRSNEMNVRFIQLEEK